MLDRRTRCRFGRVAIIIVIVVFRDIAFAEPGSYFPAILAATAATTAQTGTRGGTVSACLAGAIAAAAHSG